MSDLPTEPGWYQSDRFPVENGVLSPIRLIRNEGWHNAKGEQVEEAGMALLAPLYRLVPEPKPEPPVEGGPKLHSTTYTFWAEELDTVVVATVGESTKTVLVAAGKPRALFWPKDNENPDISLMPVDLKPYFEAAVRLYGAEKIPLMQTDTKQVHLA